MATLVRSDQRQSTFTETGVQIGARAERVLGEVRLFRSLSDEQFDELSSSSSSHRASRSQVVFCEGETLDHVYLVQSGSFKLIRHSEEGKELIVALAAVGDCFGGFAEPVQSASLAQALEESVFLLIPHAAVRRAMAANTDFAVELLAYSDERRRHAETSAARLAFESVPQRLAHLLLDESHTDSGDLRFPLNQSEIANLIGSSRETVCSILNQFRRLGMLSIQRGHIRVLDRPRLASVR